MFFLISPVAKTPAWFLEWQFKTMAKFLLLLIICGKGFKISYIQFASHNFQFDEVKCPFPVCAGAGGPSVVSSQLVMER